MPFEGGVVTGMGFSTSRSQLVARAVSRWIDQLTDLSGRNTLLYYKDLARGTLDLSVADITSRERLLAGKTMRCSRLFPSSSDRADAVRRALEIYKKIRELDEERGINAGYVVAGMATWQEDRKSPAAPVLLRALSLAPTSAARDDFELTLDEEEIVNPVLLYKLRADYRLDITPEALGISLGDDGFSGPQLVYERLRKLAGDVPGFSVSDRLVAGTFTYAKLPMVADLEGATELLGSSDLVAAIAGDPQAQRAITEQSTLEHDGVSAAPCTSSPADEFAVLDADASQSRAIHDVLAGRNVVIQGPPGTGKSQTIANLIASLIAAGSRVLFVAEKRAAIDAVLRRLAERDLTDPVLDIHDGVKNRRRIAEELESTLDRARLVPPPDVGDLHRRLTDKRDQLDDHAALMHERQFPWEVTVFDAQAGLLGIPANRRSLVRLQWRELADLHGQSAEQARDGMREYARAFESIAKADTPWAGSAVHTNEQARHIHDVAVELHLTALPRAHDRLAEVTAELGMPQPKTVDEGAALLALLSGIVETRRVLGNDAFAADDLGDLVTATASRRERRQRGSTMSWSTVRALRRSARERWLSGKPRRSELHKAFGAAENRLAIWRSLGYPGLPRPSADLGGANAALQTLDRCVRDLDAVLPRPMLAQLPLHELANMAAHLAADSQTPWRLAALHAMEAQLTDFGLGTLLAELTAQHMTAEEASDAFDSVWYASILDHVRMRDQRYAAFSGGRLREDVRTFQRDDVEHLAQNAARVRRLAAHRLRDVQDRYPGQANMIRGEAAKKRKHKPLSEVMRQAPEVMLALKPCWATSPIVVSHVLPADQLFDVVIFDEASQVKQADAIPSIMRAGQLVVAGDTRQLPPTDFFGSISESDDEEAIYTDYGDIAAPRTVGFDSILDTLGSLLVDAPLTWHYRSCDERLIAFSNEHFYRPKMTTFPGVFGESCLRHVVAEQVPGIAGQESSTTAEVDAVVALILEHAYSYPEESLGVITLGTPHMRRIEAKLQAAIAAHPELESFFEEKGKKEPYFVKNLERVQGDERDAIILSVGYGKTASGRMQYNWGPVLRDGGERRLNVAVTRAKHRITLVTSFKTEEADQSRVRSEGGKLLCAYLKYVDSGGDVEAGGDKKVTLNPFETEVNDRLSAAGIPLIPQYGVGGMRIDFAAQHPTRPGRMVLAIEADGASYHSADNARDRDRLRQEHLERLGWRFHRIWSTDWFLDPDAEIARVLAAYERAVACSEQTPEAPERDPVGPRVTGPSHVRSRAETAPTRRLRRPRIRPGYEITAYDHRQLVELAKWIESDSLLRTEDEVLTEMMTELHFRRRGPRIELTLRQAIAAARSAAGWTAR